MNLFKATLLMSLILFVGACSQKPEPLIKEQVQSSSKEDYEYLKETSKAAPIEIDLYQAIAIAIKNNRDLRIQIMDSALNQGQIDVVKFDMLPKLSANAGYKVLEKLGYFVTESSEHFAEYTPWFIKNNREDLLSEFNIPINEYIRRCKNKLKNGINKNKVY